MSTPGRAISGIVVSPLREPITDIIPGGVSDRAGKPARPDPTDDCSQGIRDRGCEASLLKLLTFTIDVNGETIFRVRALRAPFARKAPG